MHMKNGLESGQEDTGGKGQSNGHQFKPRFNCGRSSGNKKTRIDSRII